MERELTQRVVPVTGPLFKNTNKKRGSKDFDGRCTSGPHPTVTEYDPIRGLELSGTKKMVEETTRFVDKIFLKVFPEDLRVKFRSSFRCSSRGKKKERL